MPLPLCAPQTGGDNLASQQCGSLVGMQKMSSSVHGASAELIGEVSRRDGGVRDTVSTPLARCATPPMCSANRGRQSCQPVCGSEIEHQPPRHVVPLPLYAPQTGGDNHGVRYTVSTLSSRCATPPICSANRGRQSCRRWSGSSDRKDAWSGSETPRNMYKATEANRV